MRRLCFKVLSGTNMGNRYGLIPPGGLLGRERTAQVYLPEPAVSARHASFSTPDGDNWWIEDLGSTNGTLLDGVLLRSSRSPLSTRGTLKLGKTELEYWHEESAVAPVGASAPSGNSAPTLVDRKPVEKKVVEPRKGEAKKIERGPAPQKGVERSSIHPEPAFPGYVHPEPFQSLSQPQTQPPHGHVPTQDETAPLPGPSWRVEAPDTLVSRPIGIRDDPSHNASAVATPFEFRLLQVRLEMRDTQLETAEHERQRLMEVCRRQQEDIGRLVAELTSLRKAYTELEAVLQRNKGMRED